MGRVIINQMVKEFWHQLIIISWPVANYLYSICTQCPEQNPVEDVWLQAKLEEKVLASLQTFSAVKWLFKFETNHQNLIFLSYISMRLVRNSFRICYSKMLPNADIVADRFHVTKLLNQELNIARNAVLKVNEENQDKAEKSEFPQHLSRANTHYLNQRINWLSTKKNKLKQVQQVSPLLAKCIGRRHLEQSWYTSNWVNGTLRLVGKLAVLFKKSVGTISRWFGEVTGYFESGTTSGAVEVSTIS